MLESKGIDLDILASIDALNKQFPVGDHVINTEYVVPYYRAIGKITFLGEKDPEFRMAVNKMVLVARKRVKDIINKTHEKRNNDDKPIKVEPKIEPVE